MFHLKKPIRVTKKQQESFLRYVDECGYNITVSKHDGLIEYYTNHPYYEYPKTPIAESIKVDGRFERYVYVRL